MAAKSKSWLGEFWRPLAALLLWVLGMVPLIAAPPLLPSVMETRIGGLTAFPVDCIPAAPLFPSDLTRACGPPLYDCASECSVAANRGFSPASLQGIKLEARALEAQGLSRTEAFGAMRRFNAGDGEGFLFHFTNPKAAQGIVNSGEIWATQRGLAGPGVYAGTTPVPNFFQRYFSPIGWGITGASVRVPIRITPKIEQMTSTPFLPRWTRKIGEGENVRLTP